MAKIRRFFRHAKVSAINVCKKPKQKTTNIYITFQTIYAIKKIFIAFLIMLTNFYDNAIKEMF